MLCESGCRPSIRNMTARCPVAHLSKYQKQKLGIFFYLERKKHSPRKCTVLPLFIGVCPVFFLVIENDKLQVLTAKYMGKKILIPALTPFSKCKHLPNATFFVLTPYLTAPPFLPIIFLNNHRTYVPLWQKHCQLVPRVSRHLIPPFHGPNLLTLLKLAQANFRDGQKNPKQFSCVLSRFHRSSAFSLFVLQILSIKFSMDFFLRVDGCLF